MATNDRKSAEEEVVRLAHLSPEDVERVHPWLYFVAVSLAERVSVLERALRELLATEWVVSRGWGGPYDWERRDKAISEAEAALGETESK